MAKEIRELGVLKPTLDGTELLELQEAAGGVGSSKRTTAQAIASLNDAAIAAKANSTDVDAALLLKANADDVATSLALKADKTQIGVLAGVTEVAVATYTLLATDFNKAVRVSFATAITLTIPTNASAALPLYCGIPIIQGDAGAITIQGAAGVTLEAPNGMATTAKGDFRVAFQRAPNIWVIG
jgi:hypothetical protein